MKRVIVGLASTVLISGGLSLAGVGAGTAQACNGAFGPCGYGPNTWCPGQSLYIDRGGPYQGVEWDMGVCHTWYRVDQGAANVGEGPRNLSDVWEGPNPPPPAAPPPPPGPAIIGPNECLPWCS
jgi:hypothetical protein